VTHSLNEDDRTLLLRIARESIAARAGGQHAPAVAPTPALLRPAGAFVTIHRHGQLRGCIGHIEADRPLVDTVASCAVAASTADPRFPAVTAAELPAADLEISVLGPLERITSPEEVEVGRHGLLVEWGAHRGLLLPQVATEQGWDARTFVAQTCRKAGLPADALENGATLWRFEAEVFDENRGANVLEGRTGNPG
jgi:AmmeMemoRadiSam system protein A